MKKLTYCSVLIAYSCFMFIACIGGTVIPPNKFDVTINVETFDGTAQTKPIPNVPFSVKVENCSNFKSSVKIDTLMTDLEGKKSVILQIEENIGYDAPSCFPKIVVSQLGLDQYVGVSREYSNINPTSLSAKTNLNYSFIYKPKATLKLQIKRDSSDVADVQVSSSQFIAVNSYVSSSKTFNANQKPVDTKLLFDIAKGQDAEISYRFDVNGKQRLRKDTIKASQLDTLLVNVKL